MGIGAVQVEEIEPRVLVSDKAHDVHPIQSKLEQISIYKTKYLLYKEHTYLTDHSVQVEVRVVQTPSLPSEPRKNICRRRERNLLYLLRQKARTIY